MAISTWMNISRISAGDFAHRYAWAIPALLGAAALAYLDWGAWVSAHDPRWLYLNQAWWRTWLQPDRDVTLLATAGVWLAALFAYWWPRRLQRQAVGLITVATMVTVGAALGSVSLVPCRGALTESVVVAWMLGLYVGQPPSAFDTPACPGQPPLAFQLAQIVCLGATLIGAVAVAAPLWQQPLGRLRARFARDATIFTGLDAMTVPMLRRLAATRSRRNIIVIEADSKHPLLEEARATGVSIITGDPASARILLPIIAGWRGCALSYLYALGCQVRDNEAVLAAASQALRRYQPSPERQPHLVVRIDDPRHADYWRGRHIGTSGTWFEDAFSATESTAATLLNKIFGFGVRQLVICGDSTLALGILLELARRVWEQQELIKATRIGHGAPGEALRPAQADHQIPVQIPVERVILLDPRSGDLRREYLATAPQSVVDALPAVSTQPDHWKHHLLATLDQMSLTAACETAVLIVGPLSEDSLHEAGRVARLHPDTPVFVPAAAGEGVSTAIFDLLHPFQETLLVDGKVPEDTWTKMARHWHECFRLRNPAPPDSRQAPARRPWAELDHFIRQDNILQLRSIMSAVAARGRQWVPVRAVIPGSFVELSDRDLGEVACAEHTRWYQRRVKAGWSATGGAGATRNVLVNESVVPWAELPGVKRTEIIEYLKSQLAQLEDGGFVPILPRGGPPQAAEFERVGIVSARRLSARQTWVRRSGDELCGDPGDWRVFDSSGDERTVGFTEFRASHEPLGGDLWRRTGMFTAWQVSDGLAIRTKEGKANAQPGDWIVEGPRGERWPVADEQFRRTYRLSQGRCPE
jgi:hypothetical protein